MKKNLSDWQSQAKKTYDNYEMDLLPNNLKRNNLNYYYLGVYPPLTEMNYLPDSYTPSYPRSIKSLYIHVPFCLSICNFCNYYKMRVKANEIREVLSSYFKLLKQELLFHSKHCQLDFSYLYFGGGTPSLTPPDILFDFIKFLDDNNFISNEILASLEIHPNLFKDETKAKNFLKNLNDCKINRVSIGYQFDNDKLLKVYQRDQKMDFFKKAVNLILGNKLLLNVDLMYGLPEQSLNDWAKSLEVVNLENPDSITAYFSFAPLHTLFRKKIEKNEIRTLSHKELQCQQILSQLYLESKGYQELPSNFFAQVNGKPFELKQLHLPSNSASLAIGPGTYSYFNGLQFINYFDLKSYSEKIKAKKSPAWRGYHFKNIELLHRDLMFLIKNSMAIDIKQLEDKYQINPLEFEGFKDIFELLFEHKLIYLNKDLIQLSLKGRLITDEIAWLFKIPNLKKNYKKEDQFLLESYNFAMTY